MVRLPHLLALLCGFAAALAVGCGDRSNLIPTSRAEELTQQLADIRASIAAGECDGLSGRVDAFHDDAADLGGAVDKRLRSRINQGAASLREHAVSDCQDEAERQQMATQPSDTTPPETQTDTTTTETSTETVPTDTTTVPTTTTPSDSTPPATTTPETPTTPTSPTPTPPADNGGTSPDGVTP